MPTEFAITLSQQLCDFFSLQVSEPERERLAKVIDFHAGYLDRNAAEELEPLLFIEFAREQRERSLTLEVAERIVSRIQKRIFRESRRKKNRLPSKAMESQPAAPTQTDERVLVQFTAFLRAELEARDAMIFEMYFIDGHGVTSICNRLGVKKSTVYSRIRAIQEKFRTFLDDVGIPGLH